MKKHLNNLLKTTVSWMYWLEGRFKTLAAKLGSKLENDLEVKGGLMSVLLYAATALAVFYLAAILIFALVVESSDTKFGVFGDFVGGMLNPILSFLAFIGVLITIALQRRELEYSRAELKRSADALEAQIEAGEQQKFESSFFNMLGALGRIVSEIDLHNKESQSTQTGRDCFTTFYTRLTKIYRRNQAEYPEGRESEKVANAFQKFLHNHQLELATYFRFLYNTIRYIDESECSQPHHIRLLRSQISDQELLLIFYNCLTPSGSKMKPYAEKYALFDNLPTLRLMNSKHVDLYSGDAFGDNEMHHQKNTGKIQISGPRVNIHNTSQTARSEKERRPKPSRRKKSKRPTL